MPDPLNLPPLASAPPAAPNSAPPVDLSLVVPCYNEQLVLPEFHRRASAVCAALSLTYEIVLVNDGSRDATWTLLRQLAASDPHLLCVNLSRNHGHQLALSAGLTLCSGRRILILDADLQDPPELLPDMLARMDAGNDVVYGQRRQRAGENLLKRCTAALFYRALSKLSDTPLPLDAGDFRLLSRRALTVLLAMPERHRFLRGMISWIGFHQEPLLYDRDPRFAGKTNYSFPKMLHLAIDGITALSIRPLQIASWIGLITGFFALVLLIYSAIGWATGHVQSGWTSLMAAIAILSSVQLFVLGIIGEYLGRLYEQARGRPLFVIESIIRGAPPPAPPADTANSLPPSTP